MTRKRFAVLVSLGILIAGLQLAPVHAQVGVAAGLNFETLSDIEAFDATTTFDNATGYHAGIFFDLGMGPVGLRIGAFYRDLGEFDATGDVNDELEKIKLTMIDFPVDIRVNLTSSPAVQPYVLAGPVFSLPSSVNDEFDGTLQSLYISGNVGVGLSLNLGGVRLFPEVRYAIGVSNLVEDGAELGGIELQTDDTRVNSAMLRLGIAF